MANHSIIVKNYSNVFEELEANAAITPGHLVELMSTEKIRVHATSAGNALPMFALEDELQGNGIDDDYAAEDQVRVWIPGRGDIVYALLANGETAVIGSFLESNADGTLKVYTADLASDDVTIYPLQIVGQAIEAVDMSGSSGVDPDGRIKVRIV